MSSLAGKTVVIFGGSSGMGKGAAKAIVQAGGIPWIVSRDTDRLSRAVQEIGGGVKTSSVDASNEEAVAAFFEAIPQGSINHLVVTLGAGAGCSSGRIRRSAAAV